MARIADGAMTNWKDQDVMKAADYVRERDIMVTAINATDSDYARAEDLEQGLLDNQNGDHLGTWQGLTPSEISIGLGIEPEDIGAASEEDLAAVQADLNKLKTLRYNLADYPKLEGETDDTLRIFRALNDLPNGAELIFPNDTYYMSAGISLTGGAEGVTFTFEGNAKIVQTEPDMSAFSFFGQREDEEYTVTSSLTRGVKTIPLDRYPVGYIAGDLIKLQPTSGSENVEVHEITGIALGGVNLVTSPAMGTDTSADGVADDFTSSTDTGITATYTVDGAQKIELTGSESTGRAQVYQQSISVSVGTFYSLQVEAMTEGGTGTFKGRVELEFLDTNGEVLTAQQATFTNGEYQNISIHNAEAATGAVTARIRLSAVADTIGDTGSVYFKNVRLQNSAASLTIKDFIRFEKPINSYIFKMLPFERITVNNFRYEQAEESITGYGLYFEDCRAVRVNGVQAIYTANSAVFCASVMDAYINDVSIENQYDGYPGVAFYRGARRITLRGLETKNSVTAFYIYGGYDMLIDDVTCYSASLAGGYLSRWGYSSDITVSNCRFYDVQVGLYFRADGTATPNTDGLTRQNIRLSNIDIRLKTTNGTGVYFPEVAFQEQGIIFDNVHVRCLTGSEGNYSSMSNVGFRLTPVKSKVVFRDCSVLGIRTAFQFQNYESAGTANDDSVIEIRNFSLKNAHNLMNVAHCTGLCFKLYDISCDNVATFLISNFASGGVTYNQFVLDGLSLVNSPTCLIFNSGTNPPTPASGDSVRGIVRNIRSDRTSGVSPSASYNLSNEQVYLSMDGETLYLYGTAVASNTTGKVIPDGWVDGQRMRIIAQSGSWTLNAGSNLKFKTGATSITLATSGTPVASFVWMTKGTPGWYQI